MILTIILIVVFILSLAFAVFFTVQFYNIIFRGFAPLVSTHPLVVDRLLMDIDLVPGQKVYELGCGLAGFLAKLEKSFPEANYTGIEYSFWPWLVTKIQLSFAKSKIKLLKQNMFAVNLADADLIYCYLNSKMMKELEIKFKKECKLGTQIISYCFPLANLLPTKTIELADQTRIYYYQI